VTCPLTSQDRTNCLHLTEPNPTDNLGKVKVSQQRVADKCGQDDDDDDDIIIIIIIKLKEKGC
jgi:hypothetical protein